MLDYVYDNFETFQILLDGSYGTRFQHFVDRLVEIETAYTYKYMDAIHFRDKNGETITEKYLLQIMTCILQKVFFKYSPEHRTVLVFICLHSHLLF